MDYTSTNYCSFDRKLYSFDFDCQKRVLSHIYSIVPYLCSKVTWKEKDVIEDVEIFKGECLTSLKKIAEALGLTKEEVETAIKCLKKSHKLSLRKIRYKVNAYRLLDFVVFPQDHKKNTLYKTIEKTDKSLTNNTLENKYKEYPDVKITQKGK